MPRADVDLSDRRDVQAKLGTQSDVTHIFYEACFDHVEGTPEPIDTNVAMFRNLIDTVVPIATNLEYVHTGSGHNAGARIMACIKDYRRAHRRAKMRRALPAA